MPRPIRIIADQYVKIDRSNCVQTATYLVGDVVYIIFCKLYEGGGIAALLIIIFIFMLLITHNNYPHIIIHRNGVPVGPCSHGQTG